MFGHITESPKLIDHTVGSSLNKKWLFAYSLSLCTPSGRERERNERLLKGINPREGKISSSLKNININPTCVPLVLTQNTLRNALLSKNHGRAADTVFSKPPNSLHIVKCKKKIMID